MTATATPTYDPVRFENLLLYVALKCEGDPTVGATKLNKLLFFIDFAAYAQFGQPISGVEYQKLQYGPCPREVLEVRRKLETENRIRVRTSPVFGYEQQKIMVLERPPYEAFKPQEIELIDDVIRAHWGRPTSEVVAISHRHPGWVGAQMFETIPYFTVFLAEENGPTSKKTEEWAREVAERIQ